jgi:glycosyltransferase involved in cell wall biosynthesis
MAVIPSVMSGLYLQADQGNGNKGRLVRRIIPVKLRALARRLIAPSSFPQATKFLSSMIDKVQPDLIHAMRIPYEGMVAAMAVEMIDERKDHLRTPPLLISVWGNDFTLHARSTRRMYDHTLTALRVAAALHTDCARDQRLAGEFGFDVHKPKIVLPGGGGVQEDIFYPPSADEVPTGSMTLINPRGFRAYVRNDTFFHALPLILEKYPGIRIICPAMAGEGQAIQWVKELRLGSSVELLPPQSRQEMAGLFRRSKILISITTHDGTPNSLLEGMACGCFPIVGDIESLREWITPAENGLLVDSGDPQALSAAILTAIEQPRLRLRAREINLRLVRDRADYATVMLKAEEFYKQLIIGG